MRLPNLVSRYERKIFRLAKHITQNGEDAEDVLQETFLKAYEHLDQFQGESKFYTWIVRIAVNQALMKLAQAKDRQNRFARRDDRYRRRHRGPRNRRLGRGPRRAILAGRNCARFWTKAIESLRARIPHRFRPSGHRRAVDGRDGSRCWIFDSGGKEQAVARPAATP